jgi:hypothetical protein
MSFRRCITRFALVMLALIVLSGLGAGMQSVSAATLLDHGAGAVASCTGSCSVANQVQFNPASEAASPILAWGTCCFVSPFNQFSPFFSFRFFNPFMRSNTFFPFFRPFSSFFPFFRFFSRSQMVNCIQIMTMPNGQTITIRVC